MIAPELADELKMIAFCEMAKPANRLAALASLSRNGLETERVRNTLYSLATDAATPDSIKVRAIDLLDKLDISSAPKELDPIRQADLEQSLIEQYVGTT
jgi:hypothetical protein